MKKPAKRQAGSQRTPYALRGDVILRYCTCMYAKIDKDPNGDSIVITHHNPDCKLHGDNPDFDLPASIP